MMKIKTLMFALLIPFAANACIWHGGSPEHVNATTMGQELMDLKLALDNGAITDSEYRAMKAEIMNGERHQKHMTHESH